MKTTADGRPVLEASARGLGVRRGLERDIPVHAASVRPGEGGLSVAYPDARKLPPHRRPPTLGGSGKDPLFRMARRHLPDGITLRRDPDLDGHAFLEPAREMPIERYELLLEETRPRWRRILDP